MHYTQILLKGLLKNVTKQLQNIKYKFNERKAHQKLILACLLIAQGLFSKRFNPAGTSQCVSTCSYLSSQFRNNSRLVM